jgi:hypothetical protein
MNPLVRVSAAPGSSDARLLDASFLGGHDLVICIGAPLRLAREVGALCGAHGVKFMAAAVRGAASYYFADLGRHTFTPKVGPASAASTFD